MIFHGLLICVLLIIEACSTQIDFSNDSIASLTQPVGRIVGGEITTIYRYPFVVSILVDGVQVCGGSLIGPYTVLTAAHCIKNEEVHDVSQVNVRTGSTYKNYGGVVVPATKLIPHPKYRVTQLDYDIAIIELAFDPSEYTNFAYPVEMGEQDFPQGSVGTIIGWGSTSEGDPFGSEVLRDVNVPIVNKKVCYRAWGAMISPRNLCAGYQRGGKDACQGDSGGPLVVNDKLTGVVSFGDGCARRLTPGVYSSVPAYRDWIRKNAII